MSTPVAVVTGASRGLGAGLASTFAEHGFRLGLCARTRPTAPPGAEALTVAADVTDAEALDRFGSMVIDRFGRIDLWVNNAGVLEPIDFLADADTLLWPTTWMSTSKASCSGAAPSPATSDSATAPGYWST